MADLVLGLAKSAVKETVNIAKSAIEEEKQLQKSVQRDLMLVSDEFEMMHSFLNVAKDRVADDMTTTCVRQVRDMALDVEDCIDSILYLDNKSSWWRRMLPSWVPAAAPAVALDNAVAGIELLKARVEAMGQRNLRYNHTGNPGSKPAEQTHQQGAASATASNILPRSATAREAAREPIWPPVALVKLISGKGDHALQVISLLGTVGMASVIKKAYEDTQICTNFRCRAWVKLMHPFNAREFIRRLVAQFCRSYSPQESATVDFVVKMTVATEGVLINEFMKQMCRQNYLVVLEDVTTMDDWEAVRAYLPDNKNGSCIIVSTHQFEVASLCVRHPHRLLELEKISAHHSVYALVEEDAPGKVEQTVADLRETAREWLDKHPLVGQEADLLCFSMRRSRRTGPVSSVWGMSGVGKSFLVKHLCYEMRIEDPYIKFGWVNVSHPFDLMDLSWRLLLDLNPGYLHDRQMSTMKDLIQECREYLHEQFGCTIVIDGLQSTEEWDMIEAALKLGTKKFGLDIFVITNEECVAQYCATNSKNVWNVKGLGVDSAFELIAERYNLQRQGTEDKMQILHKCGGLPKVICAIADNLVSALKDKPSLEDLFAWLLSYFRSCPDILKPCIFYLSIFPLNHTIRRRRLVRRWIAEGYSRDSKENTAEKNGEISFSKLVSLSMVQVPRTTETTAASVQQSKRMPLCQVNGFFREYIISQSMEDNLVFALEGHCEKNFHRTGRHLAIDRSWDRDRNVFKSIDFSRLRSLTVFGEWKSFFISEKMRLLRVLDLEDVSSGVTNGDVEQMVKLLPCLKFLSLRRCREITHLPDSLGDLKHLQTLDIRETSVMKLPESIIKLEKLQYIRAGTTKHHQATEAAENPSLTATPMSWPCATQLGSCLLSKLSRYHHLDDGSHNCVKVPRGIGKLSNLHTLGDVDIGTGKGDAILEELKKLTQLHKLGVSGINRDNIWKLFSAISGLAHLESLSLRMQVDEDDEAGTMDGISFEHLVNLRSLKLYGLVSKLPVWTKKLKNLTKLSLQMIMLQQDLVDSPGWPENTRLFLSEFHDLHFGRQNPVILSFLEISYDARLPATITFHDDFYLKVLRIRCRCVSALRFSGLQKIKGLVEVWLSSPYDDGLKQHLESELAKWSGEIVKPILRLEEPGTMHD
uniref:NB-ARC domain-containing protein n=1 Tax=Setaria italica TaxID=4555 RepID=K3ZP12_SETIT